MWPIWLLAAMMIMMYYWRFWEPWANAMLAILLPKFWFGLKIMTGTTVFACLPGAHPSSFHSAVRGMDMSRCWVDVLEPAVVGSTSLS